jgi:cell division septation protein DedD
VSEPRTYYQISITARQAVGLFVGLLAALGLAFFFGLMTGTAGRSAENAAAPPEREAAAKLVPTPDAPPPVETGVPTAPVAGARSPAPPASAAAEPTAPATIRTFEDSADEDAAASPTPVSRTSIAAAPAVPPSAASARPTSQKAAEPAGHPASAPDGIWVQAASLSSKEEAAALGARLSKHGYHAVVVAGSGPKGKVYRVRVGPYRTETEASHAVSRLSHQDKIHEPWIVPEGK